MIDRLMISCSLIELTILGWLYGLSHMSIFQWTMLTLLVIKFAVVLVVMRQRWDAGRGDQSSHEDLAF